MEENPQASVSFDQTKRTCQRARTSVLPPLPKSQKDINLPQDWSTTKQGVPFVFYDDETSKDLMMFSTRANLELLKNCSTIYADGTFRSVPNKLFCSYTASMASSKERCSPWSSSCCRTRQSAHIVERWRCCVVTQTDGRQACCKSTSKWQ